MNCPACGAQTPVNLRFAKLMACPHCKTTLFIEDEVIKHIGVKSAIIDMPSIFTLGRRYRYRSLILEAVGRIQFDYGSGYWDEWWMMSSDGNGYWISVDEGDIAFESAIEINFALPDCNSLEIGQSIKFEKNKLEVTEINSSKCVAIEGSLPKAISPGKKYQYVECSGARGLIYTIECFEGQQNLYKGRWIDPFDIESI